MNSANAVPVTDRGMSRNTVSDAAGRVDAMTRLLRLYPAISEEERLSLLQFLTKGPPEEVVQVAQLQGLEPRFRVFREDHPADFPVGIRSWLPLILFVLIAVLGLVWRWLL